MHNVWLGKEQTRDMYLAIRLVADENEHSAGDLY